MTTLTQDQLNQLHSWYGGVTSGMDSINLNGNTYSTMGTGGQTEGGYSYNPNSIVRYIPGDNNEFYSLDQQTGQEQLTPWNKGGSLIGGTVKDLGTVAAMAGALYLGGTGLGALAGAGAGAGAGVGAAVDPMVYGGSGAATWGAGDAAAAAGAGSGLGAEVDPMMYGGGDAGTWGAGGVGAGGAGAGGYQYGDGFDPSLQTGNPADIGPPSNLAPYQYGTGYDPAQATGNPADVGPPSTLAPPPTGTGGMPGGTGTPSIPPGAIPGSGSGTGGTGTGGSGLGSLLGLLGGAYGMNQQNQASQQMLDYLKQRQQMNDNMYNPGSPEFNYLWDQMSRNDAAAGRNSQYGPRSVDLAARVAQLKMDANTKMTTGIGNLEANAINQGSNSYLNMLPGLMGLSGSNSSGGSLSGITNWLSQNFNNGGASYGGNFDPSQITTNPGDIGPPIG